VASKNRVRGAPDAASDTDLAGRRSVSPNSPIQASAPAPAGAGRLRETIEAACAEAGCALKDLTVLAKHVDPYRIDIPARHAEGQWVARQIERDFRSGQRVHIRGLHYAIVAAGNIRKPNRKIYRNTGEDWQWLAESAAKAARWLGYVDFDRISDNRNDAPSYYRTHIPAETPTAALSAWVSLLESTLKLGEVYVQKPYPRLDGFHRPQPYSMTIMGEKSSLKDVLDPICQRLGIDLYLPSGEISDTLLWLMARRAVEDGRPMVVFTVTDFDPSGYQMPVSIGRKLQAFRDFRLHDLKFKVAPLALSVDQVRDLRLPSTPLKATERRADRWRAAFGVEQTEIDALSTLQPDVLRRIVEDGIAPFHDATLNRRILRAQTAWERRARAVINEHVDSEALDAILQEADDLTPSPSATGPLCARYGASSPISSGARRPSRASPRMTRGRPAPVTSCVNSSSSMALALC
jgi:hypothetical protein